MIPCQYTRTQLGARLFRPFLNRDQTFLSGNLGLFVGVIGSVECGEAFEIVGRPGVFALKKLVDLSLRSGTLGYGCGVVLSSFLERGTGALDELFC